MSRLTLGLVGLLLLMMSSTASAQPVLARSGDHFTVTLNGVTEHRFLLFVSYFDAMRRANDGGANTGDIDTDLQMIRAAGFDGIRIFPNWWATSGCDLVGANDALFTHTGSISESKWLVFERVLSRAAAHNLLVDVTFTKETISLLPGQDLTVAEYRSQIAQVSARLTQGSGYRHVLIDVQNEWPNHQAQPDIASYLSQIESSRIATASISGEPLTAGQLFRALLIDTPRNAATAAFHDSRTSNWFELPKITADLDNLEKGIGQPPLPIYLQEPMPFRRFCPDRPGPDEDPTPGHHRTAAQNALRAGAAAWTFHTRQSFNLSTATFATILAADPDQLNELNSISSAVDAVGATRVTLASNLAPPQYAGTTVRFTATPFAGVAPHQYKWLVYDGVTWTAQGTWTTSATFDWVPIETNPNYRVGVWVRSAGNPADAAEAAESVAFAAIGATSLVLTSDKPAPQRPGTAITFTATPAGGTAPYSFKWWLYDGTTWTVLREWDPSPSFVWTPAAVNSQYRVGVWVKSGPNGSTNAEWRASVGYPTGTFSVTPNLQAPRLPGTNVQFTVSATGGTPPYQFKWWLWNGTTWLLLQDWNSSSTFSWTTPATKNAEYRVGVWLRSAGSTADAAEQAVSIPYPVGIGISTDLAPPQPVGIMVQFTATVPGASGSYEYQWHLWDGATWTTLSPWQTSRQIRWKPTVANSAYRIGVWARPVGTQPYDVASIPFAIVP